MVKDLPCCVAVGVHIHVHSGVCCESRKMHLCVHGTFHFGVYEERTAAAWRLNSSSDYSSTVVGFGCVYLPPELHIVCVELHRTACIALQRLLATAELQLAF